MHPNSMYTVAKQHQAELIAEAAQERLAREARGDAPARPQSPGRRLAAAAAAAILALSLAGAVLAAQNGSGSATSGTVDHGGEPCVVVGSGPKLAC